MNNSLTIATIGKAVGLWGEVKLHLHTDFDSQFKKGATFTTNKNQKLTIEKFNHDKSIVKFLGISTREDAQKLTNQTISTTIEESRQSCELNDDEYFWFDIIGCKVIEEDKTLGIVKDIQRLTANDYLEVKTSKEFQHFAKTFLIPYIKDVYIQKVDIENKTIYTKDAYPLLEILS
jgi:16S rRNA processing protein RimM